MANKEVKPDLIPSTTLPTTFLAAPLSNPPTYQRISFKPTLPRYDGCYAALAHNVLSPAECIQLLNAASAATNANWERATINDGQNLILDEEIRKCDRIIWDNQEVMSRIWNRCAGVFAPEIGLLDGTKREQRRWAAQTGRKWRFTRPNERMRILRYGTGEYFARESDSLEDAVLM
jgi:hypothetical protein